MLKRKTIAEKLAKLRSRNRRRSRIGSPRVRRAWTAKLSSRVRPSATGATTCASAKLP
jgi:hypothetical protein